DGVGLIANSTQIAGRTQFAVAAGINYLSVPFIQADESLLTVLQTVNVAGAWTYDGCSGAWPSYSALRPAGQNSLRTASHQIGLAVDVSSAGTFAVAGLVPGTTAVGLCRGWNLVGNPSFRSGYTVAMLKAE